ncbi:hypothetical protein M8J77_016028 [Diaphorina citri]|nr:hypothetical protein M8J77_016028 [Diaphorina citri]
MPPVGQQAIATRNTNKKSSAGTEVSSSETRKIETIVTKQTESQPNISYVVTEPKESGVKTKKSKKSKGSTKIVSGKIIKTQSSSSIATEDGDTKVKIVELNPDEQLGVTSDNYGVGGISDSNTETYTVEHSHSDSATKDVSKKTETVKMIGGKIKKFFSGDKSDITESSHKIDDKTLKKVSNVVSSDHSIIKSESRSSFKETKAASMSSKKTTGTKVIKTSTTTIIGPDGKEITTVTVSDPEITQSVTSTEKNSVVVAEGELVQSRDGNKTDYKMNSAVSSYSDNIVSKDGHTKADITAAFITNEAKSTLAGIENKSQTTEIKAKSTSDGIESSEITTSSTSNVSDNTIHDSFGSQAVDSVKMIGGKLVKMFGKSGDSKPKHKKKSQISDSSNVETLQQTESSDKNITSQSQTISTSSKIQTSSTETVQTLNKLSEQSGEINTSGSLEQQQNTRIVGGKLVQSKDDIHKERWNVKTGEPNVTESSVVTKGQNADSYESNDIVETGRKSNATFVSTSHVSSSESKSESFKTDSQGNSKTLYLDDKDISGSTEEKQNTRIVGGKLIKSKDDIHKERWNVKTGKPNVAESSIVTTGQNVDSYESNDLVETGRKSSSTFVSSSHVSSSETKSESFKTDSRDNAKTLYLDDKDSSDSIERKENTRIVGGKLIKSKDDIHKERWNVKTGKPDFSETSVLSNGGKVDNYESVDIMETDGKSSSKFVSTSHLSSSKTVAESSKTDDTSSTLERKQNTRIVGGKLIKSKDDFPKERSNIKTDVSISSVITDEGKTDNYESRETMDTDGVSSSKFVSKTHKTSSATTSGSPFEPDVNTQDRSRTLYTTDKNVSKIESNIHQGEQIITKGDNGPFTTSTTRTSKHSETTIIDDGGKPRTNKFESSETIRTDESSKFSATSHDSSSANVILDTSFRTNGESIDSPIKGDKNVSHLRDDTSESKIQKKSLQSGKVTSTVTSDKTSFVENEKLANARNNIETVETVKMIGGKIVKVPETREITDKSKTVTSDINTTDEISESSTSLTSSSSVIKATNTKSEQKENAYIKYDERPIKPAKNLDEILASEIIHSSETTEGQTVKMVGGKIIKHGKMKSPTRKVKKSDNVHDIISDDSSLALVKTDFDTTKSKQVSSEIVSRSSSFKTEKTFIKESSVQEMIMTSDGKVISSSTTTSRDEPTTSRNVRMIGGKIVKNDETKSQVFSTEQSIINEQYAHDISNLQSDMRDITNQLNSSPTSKRSTRSRSSISPDKKSVTKSDTRVTSSTERTLKSKTDQSSEVEDSYLISTDMMSSHQPVCTCPPEEHFTSITSSDFTDNVMSRTFVMDDHRGLFERDDKTSRGVTTMKDETDLTRKLISNTNIFDESNVFDERTTLKSFTDDKIFTDHDINKSSRTLVRQDTFDKSDDTRNIRDLNIVSDVRSSKDVTSSTVNSVTENYVTSTTTNVRMIGGKIVKENVTVTRKSSPSPDRRTPIKKSDRSPTPTRRTDKSPIKKVERSPSRERTQPRKGKSPDSTIVPYGQTPKPDKTTERGIRMVAGKIMKVEQYAAAEHTSNEFTNIQENIIVQSNVNIVQSTSSQDINVLDVTNVRNVTSERIKEDSQKRITAQDHREKISVHEAIEESSTTIDKKSTTSEKTTKKIKDRKDKKTEKTEIIKEQCICEICTCGSSSSSIIYYNTTNTLCNIPLVSEQILKSGIRHNLDFNIERRGQTPQLLLQLGVNHTD